MKAMKKIFAASLSAGVLLLSPGFGSYRAAAQSVEAVSEGVVFHAVSVPGNLEGALPVPAMNMQALSELGSGDLIDVGNAAAPAALPPAALPALREPASAVVSRPRAAAAPDAAVAPLSGAPRSAEALAQAASADKTAAGEKTSAGLPTRAAVAREAGRLEAAAPRPGVENNVAEGRILFDNEAQGEKSAGVPAASPAGWNPASEESAKMNEAPASARRNRPEDEASAPWANSVVPDPSRPAQPESGQGGSDFLRRCLSIALFSAGVGPFVAGLSGLSPVHHMLIVGTVLIGAGLRLFPWGAKFNPRTPDYALGAFMATMWACILAPISLVQWLHTGVFPTTNAWIIPAMAGMVGAFMWFMDRPRAKKGRSTPLDGVLILASYAAGVASMFALVNLWHGAGVLIGLAIAGAGAILLPRAADKISVWVKNWLKNRKAGAKARTPSASAIGRAEQAVGGALKNPMTRLLIGFAVGTVLAIALVPWSPFFAMAPILGVLAGLVKF